MAHNTIVMAADGRWALNIQNGSTGNTVVDNVLYNNHASRGSIDISADSRTNFTSNFNLVMERFTTDGGTVLNLAQWKQSTGQDQNSVVALPSALFVSAPSNDYHLTATSPARDAGVIRADVPTDREGIARPAGPTSDIGAYEFRSTTDSTPPLAPQGFRLLRIQ
ncbi:MAG: hypothetical protein HOP22_08725 [Nitrospiraceae bacterium]|nr:hypothetical protein [Nitrospiraceae bacterium]